MSRENIDLVERALREFAETNRPAGIAGPDFVWDMSAVAGWPDEGEYHGQAGFERVFALWTEAYDEWTFDIEEIRSLGDDEVLVVGVQRGQLKGTDSWVDLRGAYLYRVGDGYLRGVRVFDSRDEAIAAAGRESG